MQRGRTLATAPSSVDRQRADLVVPLLQQAPALGRGAVLDEVVVDELDAREVGLLTSGARASISDTSAKLKSSLASNTSFYYFERFERRGGVFAITN
jgi:hypothetical protein